MTSPTDLCECGHSIEQHFKTTKWCREACPCQKFQLPKEVKVNEPVEEEINTYDYYKFLSAKAYAAIHLRVPASGVKWLDDMIERAREQDIADKVLASLTQNGVGGEMSKPHQLVELSRKVAASMLASNKENKGEKNVD